MEKKSICFDFNKIKKPKSKKNLFNKNKKKAFSVFSLRKNKLKINLTKIYSPKNRNSKVFQFQKNVYKDDLKFYRTNQNDLNFFRTNRKDSYFKLEKINTENNKEKKYDENYKEKKYNENYKEKKYNENYKEKKYNENYKKKKYKVNLKENNKEKKYDKELISYMRENYKEVRNCPKNKIMYLPKIMDYVNNYLNNKVYKKNKEYKIILKKDYTFKLFENKKLVLIYLFSNSSSKNNNFNFFCESKSKFFKIEIKIYSEINLQKKFYFENQEKNFFEINKKTKKILIKIKSETEDFFNINLSTIFIEKKIIIKNFTKKKNKNLINFLKERFSSSTKNCYGKIKIKKNLKKDFFKTSEKKYFYNKVLNGKKISKIVFKNKIMIKNSNEKNKNFYFLKNEIRCYFYKILKIVKKNQKLKISILNIWYKIIFVIIIFTKFSKLLDKKQKIMIKNYQIKNNFFQIWKNSKLTKNFIKKKKNKKSLLIFFTISKLKTKKNLSNFEKKLKKPLKKLFLKFYQIIRLKGLLNNYLKKSMKINKFIKKFIKNFRLYKFNLFTKFLVISKKNILNFENFENKKQIIFKSFFKNKQLHPEIYNLTQSFEIPDPEFIYFFLERHKHLYNIHLFER